MYQVVEGAKRLLAGCRGIGLMHQIDVNMVGLQAAQAALDLPEDVYPGQAVVVRAGAHAASYLGGEDELIPSPLEHRANQPLGVPFLVDVGYVNEVHPEVNGLRDGGLADIIAGPTAEGAAETDGGDLDAGAAEATIVHDCRCPPAPQFPRCGPSSGACLPRARMFEDGLKARPQ